jgi:hypothetical protein
MKHDPNCAACTINHIMELVEHYRTGPSRNHRGSILAEIYTRQDAVRSAVSALAYAREQTSVEPPETYVDKS